MSNSPVWWVVTHGPFFKWTNGESLIYAVNYKCGHQPNRQVTWKKKKNPQVTEVAISEHCGEKEKRENEEKGLMRQIAFNYP